MKKSRVKILVCCHKPDQYKSDNVYMPIHVGKTNSKFDLGIQGDDEGDNISHKNSSYCELTGLYWAWKNLKDVDYIGLCHYRRYFNFHKNGTLFTDFTISNDDINKLDLDIPNVKELFKKYDIVLSKPRVYPYSIYIDYCRAHLSKDLDIVKQIIIEKYPEYQSSINRRLHNSNRLSHYNMFIMKQSEFNNYCEWLFAILGEAELRIDISSYDSVQKRIFGYLAERLLCLYVYHNKMKVKYTPVYWINDQEVQMTFINRMQHYLRNKLSFVFNRPYRLK